MALGQPLLELIIRVCVYELHEAREAGYLQANTPEKRFDEFIEHLSQQSCRELLYQKYPILPFKINKLKTYVSAALCALFKHLNDDAESLRAANLLPSQDSISLIHLERTGDLHAGGKSVFVLTFKVDNQDFKLVYKPRSLKIDLIYNQFIHWINQGTNAGLRTVKTLNKETHGWCEFVQFKQVNNTQEAAHYYKRLGGLLAIGYLLNATDMHFENFIINGDCPLIIDLECLLRPSLKEPLPKQSNSMIHTVYNVLILPQ